MGTQFACYNPHAGKGNWEQSKENTRDGKAAFCLWGPFVTSWRLRIHLFMAIIPDSPLCLDNSGALLTWQKQRYQGPLPNSRRSFPIGCLLLGPGLWIKRLGDHEDNRRACPASFVALALLAAKT